MNNNKLLLLRRVNFIGGTFRHFSAVLVNNNNHAWCSTCTLMNANCCGHEKNRRLQLLATIKAHSQQHFCTRSTTPNSNTSSSDQTTNNGIKVPDPIEQQCEHWAQIVRAEWEALNAKNTVACSVEQLRCTNVLPSQKSGRLIMSMSTEHLGPEQVRSLRQFFKVGDAVELKLKKKEEEDDFPQRQQQQQQIPSALFGNIVKQLPNNAFAISIKKQCSLDSLQQSQWLQQCSFGMQKNLINPGLLENQLAFLAKRHSDWCEWPGYATLLQAFKCQQLPENIAGLDPVERVGSSHGKQDLDPSQSAALSAALNMKRPLVAVHGPPGTGKTRLLAEYLHALNQQGKKVLVLSSTNVGFYHLLGTFCKKFPSAASSNDNFLCLQRFNAQMASKLIGNETLERLIEARSFVKIHQNDMDAEIRKTLASDRAQRRDFSGEEDLKKREADTLLLFRQMREAVHQQNDEATRALLQSNSILFVNSISSNAWLNLFTRTALTFDVVIFDDAAKLSEFECWMMALQTAPVLRLFGDYNQPGIPVTTSIGRELNFDKSLLQRLDEQFGPELNFHLQRQYRSNAAIQAWPNRAFYGQRAAEPDESVRGIRLDDLLEEGKPAPQGIITDPLVLVDLGKLEGGDWRDWMFKAENNGNSWLNWGEAFLAAFHIWHLFEHIPRLCPSEIACSTLYDAQRNLLSKIFSTLSERHLPQKLKQIRMEHNAYLQGQQFDVMLRDSVTVPLPKLFTDPYHLKHLSNEMCRARRQFIWFANSRWLEQGSEQSRQLLQTFRQHGRIIGPNELMPLEPGQFQKMTMAVRDNVRRMQQQEQMGMRTNKKTIIVRGP